MMNETWDAEDVAFERGGRLYRVTQQEREHWFVYEDELHIGEVERANGPGYMSHTLGQPLPYDLSQSENWHVALFYLIDHPAPNVGLSPRNH
jgi:hypothetical protein